MEVEEEIDGIGFGHVIAGPIHVDSFCAADHDFLRLPHLLKTLCNHDTMWGRSNWRWIDLLIFVVLMICINLFKPSRFTLVV